MMPFYTKYQTGKLIPAIKSRDSVPLWNSKWEVREAPGAGHAVFHMCDLSVCGNSSSCRFVTSTHLSICMLYFSQQ